MPFAFDTLSQIYAAPFDDVIDVRSPAEFAEDHVPGAISLPVLSNEQRAEVGTIYTQVSPFKARKVGAALVARNAADHIAGPLAEHNGAWQPLVYCWRGGQRSGSFTSILQQIGWRADVIEGGYQTYRRLVVKLLHDTPLTHRIILLDGNTGTAKTELLAKVAERAGQVLDLEGLARHRGSLFGAVAAPQPAQKGFESAVAQALTELDPAKPVLIEAESSKIGDLLVPTSLWAAMRTAPRITINAPLEARAKYLTQAYCDLIEDTAALAATLKALIRFQGHEQVASWQDMATRGQFQQLAVQLMERHYDSRYGKARETQAFVTAGNISLDTLDDANLNLATDQICDMMAQKQATYDLV